MKRTENRTAGVLCSVSSLPGPYGVGVFGEEARAFLDAWPESLLPPEAMRDM